MICYRNQIDQLKRDDESKSQSRDALSNELAATRRNIADREQELQEFARKLQDEKDRNNRNADQIDQLQNAIEQLKKVCARDSNLCRQFRCKVRMTSKNLGIGSCSTPKETRSSNERPDKTNESHGRRYERIRKCFYSSYKNIRHFQ